jgi:hypothetical protein
MRFAISDETALGEIQERVEISESASTGMSSQQYSPSLERIVFKDLENSHEDV